MVLSFICMFSYLTVEPFEHNNRPLDEAAAIQKIQRWFKQSFSNKFEFWASSWRLLATHLSSFVWRHKPGRSRACQWFSEWLEVESSIFLQEREVSWWSLKGLLESTAFSDQTLGHIFWKHLLHWLWWFRIFTQNFQNFWKRNLDNFTYHLC